MCDPVSIGIAGLAGGFLGAKLLSPDQPDLAPPPAPDIPTFDTPDAEQAQASQEDALQATQDESQSFRDRRRRTLLASGGKNSTVLTSPLGVSGNTPVARKTLLGQ